MSESKMTPGPWEICEHSWSHTGIYGADDRQIAMINIEPEATEETQADLEAVAYANARAIAAVPELIKAAQDLLNTCQISQGTTDCIQCLEAAIAKALVQ